MNASALTQLIGLLSTQRGLAGADIANAVAAKSGAGGADTQGAPDFAALMRTLGVAGDPAVLSRLTKAAGTKPAETPFADLVTQLVQESGQISANDAMLIDILPAGGQSMEDITARLRDLLTHVKAVPDADGTALKTATSAIALNAAQPNGTHVQSDGAGNSQGVAGTVAEADGRADTSKSTLSAVATANVPSTKDGSASRLYKDTSGDDATSLPDDSGSIGAADPGATMRGAAIVPEAATANMAAAATSRIPGEAQAQSGGQITTGTSKTPAPTGIPQGLADNSGMNGDTTGHGQEGHGEERGGETFRPVSPPTKAGEGDGASRTASASPAPGETSAAATSTTGRAPSAGLDQKVEINAQRPAFPTASEILAMLRSDWGVGAGDGWTNPADVHPTGHGGAGLTSLTAVSGSMTATQTAHSNSAFPATAQIAIQIGRAVKDGVDTFRIRLDPPELGRIDVKLSIGHDGRVNAVMAVDNDKTLQLLQRDQAFLERALQDAGLKTDSGSLNFSLKGEHGQSGTGGRTGSPLPSALADDEKFVGDRPEEAVYVASDRALDIRI